MRVNSSHEHSPPPRANPGHLKNARPCGQFLLANAPSPVPTMMAKCPAPKSSRPIYKNIICHFLINITASAQYNCIKQVTKWVTPTKQRQSKWFYRFYRSSMVDKCSFIPKWRCLKPLTLSAVGNDDRMLRSKFFVVCSCRGGGRNTINCQIPGPRDSSCIKCPGFARGDARGWNWLAHKFGNFFSLDVLIKKGFSKQSGLHRCTLTHNRLIL